MTISSMLLIQIIGAFMCGTCLLVIGVQNPIHSILLLIRVFFLGTLLLFFLQREYYARLFLIVYVGAIVVLFLFIIRRLELKRVNVSRRLRDLFAVRHVVLGFLLLEVLFLISLEFFDLGAFIYSESLTSKTEATALFFYDEANSYLDWSKVIQRTDHLRALGGLLYTEYKVTIILASLLLFVSRVGALAVTLFFPKKNFMIEDLTTRKRQDANIQARRHPNFLYKFLLNIDVNV